MMRLVVALCIAVEFAACGSRVPGHDSTDGGDSGPDASPPPCTTSAVLVTEHEAAYGFDAWEWARNNAYLAPDGQGGVFLTFRGAASYPFPQHLEHFDRQGRRLLGSRDAPFVVCPGALKPGLGVMVADGAGGLFMSVWLEEPRTGIRRSQVQRLSADGTPLWSASDFGVNVVASDNPPTPTTIGGDWALTLWPTADGGVAAYYHLHGTTGTFLQVFDAEGNRRWPDGRLVFVPPPELVDSAYIASLYGDGHGGFWLDAASAGPGDGTHMGPMTLFAQRYDVDGGTAFSPPGVTVADGIYSIHGSVRAWPDGEGGYILLHGNHFEPIGIRDQSWSEALFVSRVAPDGDLLWAAGVPLTTTMGYVYRMPGTTGTPEGVPDGRGGFLVAWPEDRDGDGENECYGQYVAPDGTPAGPADGASLAGGAELLCTALFSDMFGYRANTTDGDMVFTAMQPLPILEYLYPWRLSFQKLHCDLTARWGPEGVFAMACDPDLATSGTCSKAVLDYVEGVVPDAEGGVHAAWSTCDQLWILHITSDGRTDWTP